MRHPQARYWIACTGMRDGTARASETPPRCRVFDPNTIAGVQNTAVVSVRNDQDNSTQQKIWRGSVTQHASETKTPNTIYVEESTALLRPGTFDPNTIGGVENNNVRTVQEARVSGSVSVWVGSEAEFTALTTYVLNRFYITPYRPWHHRSILAT